MNNKVWTLQGIKLNDQANDLFQAVHDTLYFKFKNKNKNIELITQDIAKNFALIRFRSKNKRIAKELYNSMNLLIDNMENHMPFEQNVDNCLHLLHKYKNDFNK